MYGFLLIVFSGLVVYGRWLVVIILVWFLIILLFKFGMFVMCRFFMWVISVKSESRVCNFRMLY